MRDATNRYRAQHIRGPGMDGPHDAAPLRPSSGSGRWLFNAAAIYGSFCGGGTELPRRDIRRWRIPLCGVLVTPLAMGGSGGPSGWEPRRSSYPDAPRRKHRQFPSFFFNFRCHDHRRQERRIFFFFLPCGWGERRGPSVQGRATQLGYAVGRSYFVLGCAEAGDAWSDANT